MSFILDALKKSELERQRQAIPGLVEAGIARPRQRLPGWAIALCLLLGINLAVLLVLLARGWMNTRAAGSPAAIASAADDPAAAAAGHGPRGSADSAGGEPSWSPLDAAATEGAPVYAPEVPVNSAAPMPEPPSATAPAARQPAPGGAAAHALRRRDPVLNDRNYQPDEDESLPSVNELSLTGAQALPELHLDVHVYATNSAERFVFINMRKYHEGATLQEGPTIERIRRDGVILNYQGLRFLLPRQ